MPSAQPSTPPPEKSILGGNDKARPRAPGPLAYSGSLDAYDHNDSTPTVGREFSSLQIKKLLTSPDADTLIRDLAITGKFLFHVHVMTGSTLYTNRVSNSLRARCCLSQKPRCNYKGIDYSWRETIRSHRRCKYSPVLLALIASYADGDIFQAGVIRSPHSPHH